MAYLCLKPSFCLINMKIKDKISDCSDWSILQIILIQTSVKVWLWKFVGWNLMIKTKTLFSVFQDPKAESVLPNRLPALGADPDPAGGPAGPRADRAQRRDGAGRPGPILTHASRHLWLQTFTHTVWAVQQLRHVCVAVILRCGDSRVQRGRHALLLMLARSSSSSSSSLRRSSRESDSCVTFNLLKHPLRVQSCIGSCQWRSEPPRFGFYDG